jgi:hypothetical protein
MTDSGLRFHGPTLGSELQSCLNIWTSLRRVFPLKHPQTGCLWVWKHSSFWQRHNLTHSYWISNHPNRWRKLRTVFVRGKQRDQNPRATIRPETSYHTRKIVCWFVTSYYKLLYFLRPKNLKNKSWFLPLLASSRTSATQAVDLTVKRKFLGKNCIGYKLFLKQI